MPEPRLISSYLDALAAQLPASMVEELADGLAETHRSYLRQGLAPDLAARSAVAEFGEPQVIVAGFARVNPARRAARRLLGIGPVVGACWLAALVTMAEKSRQSARLPDSAWSPAGVSWYSRRRRPPTTDQEPAIRPACSSRRSAG